MEDECCVLFLTLKWNILQIHQYFTTSLKIEQQFWNGI